MKAVLGNKAIQWQQSSEPPVTTASKSLISYIKACNKANTAYNLYVTTLMVDLEVFMAEIQCLCCGSGVWFVTAEGLSVTESTNGPRPR